MMRRQVLWSGNLPSHWCSLRLKWTIRDLRNGTWGSDPDGENDIPCVRVADFDRERLRVSDTVPTLRAVDPSERRGRILRRGDLLIEKSGGGELQPVGTVVIYDADVPAVCSNFIARLTTAQGYEPRYLKYLHAALYATRVTLRSIKQTTGIQNLDSYSYFCEHVPSPPIEDQRAIADFLDRETARIEGLIYKKQALSRKLEDEKNERVLLYVLQGTRSSVEQRFSGSPWLGMIPSHWKTTRLKYATSLIVDCPHETPVYSPDGEYHVVRTADITFGTIDLRYTYRLAEDEYRNRIRRAEVLEGDIVYGREGERWGFAASVPAFPTLCLGQRMMQFRSARHFAPRFLMWHLNARCVYEQGGVDTVGATSPHVNVQTIRNYQLVEPPVSEQHEIAQTIDSEVSKIDELIVVVANGIARLNEYRSALISAAVTGQIDVRNYRRQEAAALCQ